jgi:hypothetical protein
LGFGSIGLLVPRGNQKFLFYPSPPDSSNLYHDLTLFAIMCSWTKLVVELEVKLALVVCCPSIDLKPGTHHCWSVLVSRTTKIMATSCGSPCGLISGTWTRSLVMTLDEG